MKVLIVLILLGAGLGGARRMEVFKEAETFSFLVRKASDPLLSIFRDHALQLRTLCPLSWHLPTVARV